MEKSIEKRSVEKVEFAGKELMAVKENERIFVALKPICEALGLDWEPQRKLITSDPVLSSVTSVTEATGSDGKQYEMVCLPLDYLNGWLFKISAKRYKGERQAAIIQYQKECYRVLAKHFSQSPFGSWSSRSHLPSLAERAVAEGWDAARDANTNDEVKKHVRKETAYLRIALRRWANSMGISDPTELQAIADGAFGSDRFNGISDYELPTVWGWEPYHPATWQRSVSRLLNASHNRLSASTLE